MHVAIILIFFMGYLFVFVIRYLSVQIYKIEGSLYPFLSILVIFNSFGFFLTAKAAKTILAPCPLKGVLQLSDNQKFSFRGFRGNKKEMGF